MSSLTSFEIKESYMYVHMSIIDFILFLLHFSPHTPAGISFSLLITHYISKSKTLSLLKELFLSQQELRCEFPYDETYMN